ncbi:MAG: hypothetical protein IBX67_02565 [Dehalococcoidia bacterium]|nr:hypothetical protein [Dehalococcoidia bacterium]
MSNKTEVAVSPVRFALSPGESAEATATIRNLGQSVDQLTLSIEGLAPEWYTLPVSSAALFPNDQDNLKIVLHPPESTDTRSGSYPFRVSVVSQEWPAEKAAVDLVLEVQSIPELELSLSAQTATGRRGVYRVMVNNPGGKETTVRLSAKDSRGVLRYSLQPDGLTVPGGGRAEATLEARAGGFASIFGGRRQVDFQVSASFPGAGEGKTVGGQMTCIPWVQTLPRIRFPGASRPPTIDAFKSTTEDRREFKLSWSVKRATEVKIDGEDVEPAGSVLVRPAEPRRYVLTADNKHGSSSQTIEVSPLPLREVKVSERIRASLTPTELQVQAGAFPTQATLQIQNLGEIVDKFLVEIEGLDETWYSRSASSIALMPQASDQVQISFQPPKKRGVKAKAYPFTVNIHSQSVPGEATSITAQLEILPAIDFKVTVNPYRVSGRKKGTFRVNLANTGVSDIKFALSATDLEEGLRLDFKTDNPEVAAWNTLEVPMLARPKRSSRVGEKKRYDITVTAGAGEGNVQTANCELHHSPLIGSWRPIIKALRVGLFLALIGGGIYFLLRLGGGLGTLMSSPQTWVTNLGNTVQSWFYR